MEGHTAISNRLPWCPATHALVDAGKALTGILGQGRRDRHARKGRRAGVLISMETGVSVAYAMWKLEDRGHFFIGVQEPVYTGMIIGEHNRDNDLEVNPLKGKQLTNVRASGTDEAVRLTTPVKLSLEQSIAYIDDDEMVEVTPLSIRLRKAELDPNERKKMRRKKDS
jgi:GTP-binding protein